MSKFFCTHDIALSSDHASKLLILIPLRSNQISLLTVLSLQQLRSYLIKIWRSLYLWCLERVLNERPVVVSS
jgi:hypothetical protein